MVVQPDSQRESPGGAMPLSNALFRHEVQSNKATSDKHKRTEALILVIGSTVRCPCAVGDEWQNKTPVHAAFMSKSIQPTYPEPILALRPTRFAGDANETSTASIAKTMDLIAQKPKSSFSCQEVGCGFGADADDGAATFRQCGKFLKSLAQYTGPT